jgi:hypothetical protein
MTTMTRRAKPATKTRTPTAAAAPMGGDLFTHPDASTFTGKIDKTVKAKLAALPFVRSRKRGDGRVFWSVTASGNYFEDYDQGRAWARLVLPLLKCNVGAPLLSWIVRDMIVAGDCNGLVLGFIREIGDQLKSARANLLFAAAATEPKVPALHQEGAAAIRKAWRNGRAKLLAEMANAV